MATPGGPRLDAVLWSRRAVDLCRVATCLCLA
ncbi:MAG TPA: putative leader peptide [Mycobacteriales bacterium]|nr:putative leader peptide [Mycobacteriales bacterium]